MGDLRNDPNINVNKTNPAFSAEGGPVEIGRILSTIWHGKWIILVSAILSALVGAYMALQVPLAGFEATSALRFQKDESVLDQFSNLPDSPFGNTGDYQSINTELISITSYEMISKLVDNLDLMQDPRYNLTLAGDMGILPIQDPEAKEAFNPIKSSKKLLIRLLRGPTPEKSPNAIELEERASVIRDVSSMFFVENVDDSFIFSITAFSDDPKEAIRLADGLADVYIQDSIDQRLADTEKSSIWLSEKAAELKTKLIESEKRIKEFDDRSQLVSAEILNGLNRQIKDTRQRILDIQEDIITNERQISSINTIQNKEDLAAIAQIENDQRLSRLASDVRNRNLDDAVFRTRLEAVVKLKSSDISRLKQQANGLAELEKSLKAQITVQSDDLVQLQELQREATADTLLYESFLSRLKEITVQQGLLTSERRLLTPATAVRSASQNRRMFVAVTLLLGGLLGTGIVLLREFLNNTFRTLEEIEDYTSLRVIGSIPKLKKKSRKDIFQYSYRNPASTFSETVRNLRTSILMSDVDNPPQVIMVCSSLPNEGKTTISMSLAQNMAGLGKRVLLVEGDMRKRVFSEVFKIDRQQSFVDVIMGEAKLDDCIFPLEELGIDLLFSGRSNANAADIFASQKFTDLIVALRKKYDYIIFDTPPVLVVPDARVIACQADSIVMVVKWNSTTKRQLKDGVSMLSSLDINIDGLIMSQVDARKAKRYGYTDTYGYYYGKGSGYHAS